MSKVKPVLKGKCDRCDIEYSSENVQNGQRHKGCRGSPDGHLVVKEK